jgi:dephospho-CoA kinase
MLRVAVTGGIACGKSLVGNCLAEMQVPVCDTDELAHRLLMPGEAAYAGVVARFGSGIVLPTSGEIDRTILGSLVFNDETARRDLNDLVHPHVWTALDRWFAECEQARASCAVALVPLLFETGAESRGWAAVVCVTARDELVEERLIAYRGLTPVQARQRVAAQLPNQKKAAQADYVIVNNGGVDCVKQQAESVIAKILQKEIV